MPLQRSGFRLDELGQASNSTISDHGSSMSYTYVVVQYVWPCGEDSPVK